MRDGDAVRDEMLRVAGISEMLRAVDVPGSVFAVQGDPAELVAVWRRGAEVLYAHPSQLRSAPAVAPASQLFEVAGVNEAPRKDSVLAARWDYVHDVIGLERFEQRVWDVLVAMERRR